MTHGLLSAPRLSSCYYMRLDLSEGERIDSQLSEVFFAYAYRFVLLDEYVREAEGLLD